MSFQKTLDGEMRDATESRVVQGSKMLEKEAMTETEEAILWDTALLGANTAELLLNTEYFYNGKLLGLQTGEHRLIHLSDVVDGNKIVFDEFRCKTFKLGQLKDLKNKPSYIEHICHKQLAILSHSPCLASMYSKPCRICQQLLISSPQAWEI